MKDIKFVESGCNREQGKITMLCMTDEAYTAVMELLNDGEVIE